MKEVKEKMYEVKHVSVDCELNDPVDVRCGGPRYLGFDFYVDADLKDDTIRKFVIAKLMEHKRDMISVNITKNNPLPKEKIWTFDRIEKCIIKGY